MDNKTSAETELLLRRLLDTHHEKLKEELPTVLQPMMQKVAHDTVTELGKRFGMDLDSVDASKKHHDRVRFVDAKMELEGNIKRTIFADASRYGLAGLIGWIASKFT